MLAPHKGQRSHSCLTLDPVCDDVTLVFEPWPSLQWRHTFDVGVNNNPWPCPQWRHTNKAWLTMCPNHCSFLQKKRNDLVVLKSLKSISVGMFVYIYTGVNQETKEVMRTKEEYLQDGPKKRRKSNSFIIAEIIVCWIQSMDQSSTYLLSKRGSKDISIAFRIFEKQIRMWYMVEIAVNRLLKSSCFMFSCWPAPNNHKDWYNYEIISVNSSAGLFHTPPKSRTKDSYEKIRFWKDFL